MAADRGGTGTTQPTPIAIRSCGAVMLLLRPSAAAGKASSRQFTPRRRYGSTTQFISLIPRVPVRKPVINFDVQVFTLVAVDVCRYGLEGECSHPSLFPTYIFSVSSSLSLRQGAFPGRKFCLTSAN